MAQLRRITAFPRSDEGRKTTCSRVFPTGAARLITPRTRLAVLRTTTNRIANMMRLILGVATALLLSAGPAAADGLPSKGQVRAPVAAGPNWNGFYVGLGIGAGAVVHDLSASATYN